MAKPSKSAQIAAKLPRATIAEDPSFEQKVVETQNEMRNDPMFKMTPAWLAQEYAEIRDEKDVVEAQLADVNVRLEAVKRMMVAQFEAEGLGSITTSSGRSVSVWLEPDGQVVDKEAFRRWCEADPDLRLKMQLWPSTMKSLVKERLAMGDPTPPGVEAVSIVKVRLNN